jgi:plasmid maintenance system antidote protein VapI
MKKLQLNIKLILAQLETSGKTKSDLARGLGITRQAVYSLFKRKSPLSAGRIANFFKGNPKDYVI